ncbi:snaclec coagulation factor IX/factor X-binding protein subunit B-like [Diadema antillarum]|uniref:snaclec coagulation factor IX/factor X-binding protein subunit B-like n=1 Tax=Diadema antillarum TaxID=105358 RepID=UPI003A8AC866
MLRLAIFAVLAVVVSACPFGWSQSGSSCYRISDKPDTWVGAVRACSRFSSCASGFAGHLVAITTSFENQQVMDVLNFNNMQNNEMWLGLRTPAGPVAWESGEALNPALRNTWHPGNPRRGYNMCTVALRGRWASRPCNSRRYYVCEMGGDPAPTAMLLSQGVSPEDIF